jgi:glycerophosphoryl diester phosphodiesterase
MSRPLVIAHRGYSACYMENTLAAYRAAISAGADLVESDARLSKDGRVWSCHDASLERISGHARAVADMTSSELSDIALPDGERLVALGDVLSKVAPERQVLIDVKTEGFDLIEAIVHDVAEASAHERVWIGMRDERQLRRARELEPRLSLLAFLPDYASADAFENAGANALRVWEGDLHQPDAAALVRERRAWVTVGGRGTQMAVGDTTFDDLRRILDLDPGAILLNDPTLLLSIMEMSKSEDGQRGSVT